MRLSSKGCVLAVTIGIVTGLGVVSCLGDHGGNGRKGLDHQLEVFAVAPEEGPKQGGTDVLIVGFNFNQDGPVTDVLFGTTPAASFSVQSNNQIDAVTPAHLLGRVDVSVRNADGDEATLADAFEFVGPPATCISVVPGTGLETGGETVVISTSGFLDDFTVDVPLILFDADPVVSVTPIGPTTVEIVTPPSLAPAPFTVDVTVEGMGLPETCTFLDGFTYLPVPPSACMEVAPSSGPLAGGTSVTITSLGKCFWNGSSVPLFGGIPAINVVLLSSTVLVCDTPASAPPPGPVAVEVSGETASGDPCTCLLPDGFTYRGLCTITSVTPSSGPTNGGISVTITGSGFDPAGGVDVMFGAAFAERATILINWSGTAIDCTLPSSCVSGVVDVTVINLATRDTCTLPGGFEYTSAGMGVCAIASITPNSGPLFGGNTVMISGTGFEMEGGVTFGGRPAIAVVFVSSTLITVVTPPGDGPGPVDVCVSPANSDPCVAADAYTYQ